MSNTTNTKPAAILQLEKELGIELKQVALDEAMPQRNSFALSQQGDVIGLNLGKNQLTNIYFLQHLTQLIYLNLWNNKITDINPLQHLTQLTYLNLWNNNIIDINPLQYLTRLTKLYLWNNKIVDINPLQYLTQLTCLSLHNNKITNINSLQYLVQLISLDLSNNKITDINSLQHLVRLIILALDNNRIVEVPIVFSNCFPYLKSFHLYRNLIQNIPIEIWNKYDFNFINSGAHQYLKDVEKGQRKVYQAKVILIGNGRVGKTCLVKRWLDNEFDEKEPSTHAIQLRRYFLKQLAKEQGFDDIQLQIWDFGGQDIYHATHRLFMQTRALFILVWDQQTENALSQTEKLDDNSEITYQNYPLRYYLDYAKNLGKDSPILIVQTKKDRDKKCEIKDWNFLKENYNIIESIAVESSKDKRNGFDQFESCLEEHIETMLKETCTALPTSWWKVQLGIQKLQSKLTKNITVDKFHKICQKYELNQEHGKTLLQYLHDTGALFYKENLFQNQIILDQKWAIDAVYTLFDRKGLFPRLVQKGIFSTQDLKYAWQDFSQEEQALCLDFMKSCEICFEIGYNWDFEKRQFLAPALLPENKPIELNEIWQYLDNKRIIRYQYRFLHYGNLQSFIVRTNKWSTHASLWKNGCQLKDNHGNLALIEGFFSQEKQYLEIQITGKNPQPLLDKIRNELEKIQQYDKVSELWSIDGVSFVEREKVEQHPKENLKIQTTDGNWLNYSDFALFLNKNPKETFMKTETNKKEINIFVSYASQDRDLRQLLVEGLERHLKQNKHFKYHFWVDKDVLLGENWKRDIEKSLQETKSALLLVDSFFAASGFINDEELPVFFKRKQEEGYVIIPVLVRDYDIGNFKEISTLNFFDPHYRDYGFTNDPLKETKMMPFDKLRNLNDSEKRTDLLEQYYAALAQQLNKTIKARYGQASGK